MMSQIIRLCASHEELPFLTMAEIGTKDTLWVTLMYQWECWVELQCANLLACLY